jgi:hypothetical protein
MYYFLIYISLVRFTYLVLLLLLMLRLLLLQLLLSIPFFLHTKIVNLINLVSI